MTGLQVTEVILIIALYDFLKTVLRAILDFIDDDEESEDDKGILDKIRVEIIGIRDKYLNHRDLSLSNVAEECVQIIDKYRTESEDNE